MTHSDLWARMSTSRVDLGLGAIMNRTSISDLKVKAKDQLLGNYGIATGSFALLFVLIYAVMMIIMSALAAGTVGRSGYEATQSFGYQMTSQIMSIVIGTLSSTVSVGYIYILKRIADGEYPVMSDLFFVFKNHPDKVIIISLVMTVSQVILLLPATILANTALFRDGATDLNGKMFLVYIILYLTGLIISLIIDLMLAMSFMIYLDNPTENVTDMMKRSISMMKGNKFRYFYMILSFFGYWLLILLSLGIAALWVMPYQTMAMVCFYYDLRDGVRYAKVEEL